MTKNPFVDKAFVAVSNGILLDSLRNRAKWPWVRDYLKSKDVKPGGGWGDVKAELDKGKDANTLREVLIAYYHDVMIAGDKYVELFELDQSTLDSLTPSLCKASIPPSSFLESYPYCLEQSKLHEATKELTLCEVRDLDGDFALVFCSRREFVERLRFEGEAAQAIIGSIPALDGYSSFVALKTQSFQAFDVAIVRTKLRRVEMMIDIPLVRYGGLDKAQRVLQLVSAVGLYVPPLKFLLTGESKYNLFTAIDGMYRNENGGVLQSLKVRTSSGLVDHLRTTLPSDDLRINKYHTASQTAVNDEIDPFEITTRVELTMPPASVEVRLAAPVATLAAPLGSRWLHGLDLADCNSQRDAVRAINRVVSFAT